MNLTFTRWLWVGKTLNKTRHWRSWYWSLLIFWYLKLIPCGRMESHHTSKNLVSYELPAWWQKSLRLCVLYCRNQLVFCVLLPELGIALPSSLCQSWFSVCTSWLWISHAEEHATEISVPGMQHYRPMQIGVPKYSSALHSMDLLSLCTWRHLPPSDESLQVVSITSIQRLHLCVKLCTGTDIPQKCLQSS